MEQQILLLGDVARLIGVKRYRITYAIANGLVSEPAMRITNKRIFNAEDVARLAEHFKKTDEGQPVSHEAERTIESNM